MVMAATMRQIQTFDSLLRFSLICSVGILPARKQPLHFQFLDFLPSEDTHDMVNSTIKLIIVTFLLVLTAVHT